MRAPELFALALDFIPDVVGLRLLNNLPAELSDAEVAEYMFQRRRAATGADELLPHVRRSVGFALFGQHGDEFRMNSFSSLDEGRVLHELVSACAGAPELCRWDEREAGLTSLRLRLLQTGSAAAAAWPRLAACRALAAELEQGVVSSAGLAEVARLSGLPLMHGTDPEWQWQQVQAGEWSALRARAELRAVSAWLLWQRQLLVCGELTQQDWLASRAGLERWLSQQPAAHLQHFLAA